MASETLVDCLKKYVNHKEMVYRTTSRFKSLAFLSKLEKCKMLVLHVNQKTVTDKNAAALIIHYKQHLEAILPYPNNPSYQTSIGNLNKIITQCNNIIQENGEPILQ
jgi:hypothetical protein